MARVSISVPLDIVAALPLRLSEHCNCGRISCAIPPPIDRVISSIVRTADSVSHFSVLNSRRKGCIETEAMSGAQGKLQMARREGVIFDHQPDHLLVLVHGILASGLCKLELKGTICGGFRTWDSSVKGIFFKGAACGGFKIEIDTTSPSDWNYVQAELRKRLGNQFFIYASAANSYVQTLDGIDVAGRRLAEEVHQVIHKTPSLRRVSFLAHSLGGLFARYAISVLYSENSEIHGDTSELASAEGKPAKTSTPELGDRHNKVVKGTIAGLEAINFITLATPHLGVRGKRQLPFLLGVSLLEKLAIPLAPYVIGRTGCQLFLTDGKASRPPLLLRMTSDCEDGRFVSALGIFKSRILYANVSYDHMVGWRTSSIRRETELVKPPKRSLDGYKHVVDVIYCPPVQTDGPSYPPETAKAKEAAQTTPTSRKANDYYDMLEEEMIWGLQQVGWKKVDVSFHSTLWPFFAHNNIHVKQEWLHYAGAGVVAHVADTLKQQEIVTFFAANL